MATSINNLAELYRTQGKYAEAEPLYQRALKISEEALGLKHPNVTSILNYLALLEEVCREKEAAALQTRLTK